MRRRLVNVARRSAVGRASLRRYTAARSRVLLKRHMERILAAGILDRAWYEAQVGDRFASDAAAAADYLTRGRSVGLSIHPFLEPAVLAGRNWRTRAIDPVITYLDTPAGKARTYPNFDETAWYESHPEAAEHPGRAVGHFTATAQDDTEIPVRMRVPGEPLTWGTWRSRALESIAKYPAWRALTSPRLSDVWDGLREQEFRAQHASVPLPDDDPLVSIVMPVRNRPVLVVDAVRSAQRQTFSRWELLVVDDGSSDETPDVIERLAADDPRIRLLRRAHGGVCAARNAGLAAARGRYIAFLDSDNTWRPDFLETGVRGVIGRGVRAAYAGLAVHEGGVTRFRGFEGGREHLLVINHVDQNVLIAERTLLEELDGFDTRLRRWVDHDLVLRISSVTTLAYLPFIGADISIDPDRSDRITTSESEGWGQVVLQKHMIDWDRLRSADRVAGRISVVIPTLSDVVMTFAAVDAVLTATPDLDVEVVVVDNGSARYVAMMLDSVLPHVPHVTLVRNPRNLQFALGSNVGLAATTGQHVVFLNNDTEVQPGWLKPLLDELADTGVRAVQPLLTYPDGTIQCAGVVFPGGDGLPSHFLVDFPVEDAQKLGRFETHALTGAALAMRAADALEMEGFDPIFMNGWEDVDLCLRLSQAHPGGSLRVVPDSHVIHLESRTPGRERFRLDNRRVFLDRWSGRLPDDDRGLWRRAGFVVTAYEKDGSDPLDVPCPVLERPPVEVVDGIPQLRWAIKIGATPGRMGDHWGDVFFAADLARALQALGQEAIVDRRESWSRSTARFDDVSLSLRGLYRVPLEGDGVHLLWVISHPDLVDADELREHDAAFAASRPWSRRMSLETGVEVRPLLQATEPSRFHPVDAVDDGPEFLFVGSYRENRRVLLDALDAGLPVSVYGKNWQTQGIGDAWVAEFLPNDELGRAYASAGVVLCDQAEDMAREGFIANRLFDAVACGARVVCDDVEGVEDVFGDLVLVVRDRADLVALADADVRRHFLPDDERRARAVEFGATHSFDARARELLDMAVRVRQSRDAQ